jgi:predicted MPP superfamily phosphohydrolase
VLSGLTSKRGRWILVAGGALLLAATAACLFWGLEIEPDRLVVHRERVTLEGFPPMKLVVISDLHAGSRFVDRAKLDALVRLANAESPDAVLLLGDFVTGHRTDDGSALPQMPPSEIAEALRPLRATHGVIAVLGNHDWWFDAAKVRSALESVGIRVLSDDAVPIEGGKNAWFVGLADQLEGHADLGAAFGKLPPDARTLVLVHEPDVLSTLPRSVALTLAGHTHGGQVDLPVVGRLVVPSEFGQRYAAGWVDEGGRRMFVTTGVGTSIWPVRFGVPPELVVLEVNRANEPVP